MSHALTQTLEAQRPAAAARRWIERALADGLVVAAVLAWWALSSRLPSFVLPDPWSVAKTTAMLFADPAFLVHTLTSTVRVVTSVVVAMALGFALAVIARYVPIAETIVNDRIQTFLNSFPSVGWAVLAVIWFDVSNFSVIFVQVAILVPFCLINLGEGLRQLDAETIEMARSFTRNPRRILLKVVIPMLMPYTVAALRIAYGIGWKIALVSELFGADRGLGFLMVQAQTVSDAAMVFATCFAVVVIFTLGERLAIDPLARRYTMEENAK